MGLQGTVKIVPDGHTCCVDPDALCQRERPGHVECRKRAVSKKKAVLAESIKVQGCDIAFRIDLVSFRPWRPGTSIVVKVPPLRTKR